MNYIDIHTHSHKNDTAIEIVNVFAQNLDENKTMQKCSAGFHPWHINDCNETDTINELHFHSSKPEVLAIGECGLDKKIDIVMDVQKRIFLKQAGIAENKQKPLILHCVKAFNEIIELKNKIGATVPWILHGYSRKTSVTKQLLQHGFYFSFGEQLLHKIPIAESLKIIPIEQVFFETDESNIKIEEIYSFAANVLSVNVEALKEQIFNNYKRIFQNG